MLQPPRQRSLRVPAPHAIEAGRESVDDLPRRPLGIERPAARQRRRYRERNEERRQRRHGHDESELAQEEADRTRQERDRQEYDDDDERDDDRRDADLAQSVDGREMRRLALAIMPLDILEHDDGIVNEYSDHQRHRQERDGIERKTGHPHCGHRDEERSRHCDHDDDRVTPRA